MPDKAFVEFRVEDDGIGIPKEKLPNLFKPFAVVSDIDPSFKQDQGTGLGLSLVKALVEGQGGNIRISSEEGKGTPVLWTVPSATSPMEAAL